MNHNNYQHINYLIMKVICLKVRLNKNVPLNVKLIKATLVCVLLIHVTICISCNRQRSRLQFLQSHSSLTPAACFISVK